MNKVAMIETCESFPYLEFGLACIVVAIIVVGIVHGFREQERFIREECGGIWL